MCGGGISSQRTLSRFALRKKNTRAGRAVMMAYKKARLNGKPYSSALDPGPRTQAAPPTPATPLLLPPTLPLAEDDDDVDDGNVL